MNYNKRKSADVFYTISKILCAVGGVACFGLVLGTVGAVDMAGSKPVSGWILQFLMGIAGMSAFVWISGKLDD